MTKPTLRELAEASRVSPEEDARLIAADRDYRSRRKSATWKFVGVFALLIFGAGFIRGSVSDQAGDIVQWLAILGSAGFAFAIWPKKVS